MPRNPGMADGRRQSAGGPGGRHGKSYREPVAGWLLVGLLAAVPSLLQTGCNGADRERAGGGDLEGRLQVVATYSILGDLTQQVAGERAAVSVLVGPGGDAHTYEPTPRDSAALARASLVLENGLGFEPWLDRLLAASGSRAWRVAVTADIVPRRLTLPGGRSEVDPHVWHDPLHAAEMARVIAGALAQADPAGAGQYREAGEACARRLESLHAWVLQQVASIPPPRRKLVTAHDTFGYFADRYGFESISLLGSSSSETSDPSAARVAEVVGQLQQAGVPAVFAENILSPRLTEQIAAQAGIRVVATLYTDALGPPGSGGDTYEKMLRHNVTAIVEALK